MKNFALRLILLILPLNILNAQPLNYLATKLSQKPQYKHAQIGIFAINLNSGKILINFNANQDLIPASTQKLFTTAAALTLLGPNAKFNTLLQYDGTIRDSILYGNLFIYGMGDPTLGSKYFSNNDFWSSWLDTIQNLGIKEITGKIIADPSYFDFYLTPQKWTWEDLGNYYGASPSAICIYDNTFRIIFKTASAHSKAQIIDLQPNIPQLKIVNNVQAANIHSDKSYIIGAPFSYNRLAIGRLPANRDSFAVKASIPDPAWLLAWQLKQKLENQGIKIQDTAITTRTFSQVLPVDMRKTFFTWYSPPLDSIIRLTNHKSINLYAEMLLIHLGKQFKGNGNTWNGLRVLYKLLDSIGIDTTTIYLTDGSGLSRYNAVTAYSLVKLLTYMYNSPQRQTFLASLPVAGQTGTLKYVGRHTDLQGRMIAKSGSMKRVRNYAGYLIKPNGQIIAFAILLNNFNCSQTQARLDIQRLLINLLNYD